MYIESITELAPQIIPLNELAIANRSPIPPTLLKYIAH